MLACSGADRRHSHDMSSAKCEVPSREMTVWATAKQGGRSSSNYARGAFPLEVGAQASTLHDLLICSMLFLLVIVIMALTMRAVWWLVRRLVSWIATTLFSSMATTFQPQAQAGVCLSRGQRRRVRKKERRLHNKPKTERSATTSNSTRWGHLCNAIRLWYPAGVFVKLREWIRATFQRAKLGLVRGSTRQVCCQGYPRGGCSRGHIEKYIHHNNTRSRQPLSYREQPRNRDTL